MEKNTSERYIEVCFTPVLFPYIMLEKNYIVVLADILRATTSICTAFENGAEAVIPVADFKKRDEFKSKGYVITGERDGSTLEGADFGNSPFYFSKDNVKGKTVVVNTTNGTQAIEMVKNNCEKIAIGSFINMQALSDWLVKQNTSVLILCAGWKNKFSLEDSVFAGALTESLLKASVFKPDCDSATASLELWNAAKHDLVSYMDKALHRHRLKKLGLDDVIEYCFTLNLTKVVPVLQGTRIVDISK